MKFIINMNIRKRLTAILLAVAMMASSVQAPGGISYAAELAGSSVERGSEETGEKESTVSDGEEQQEDSAAAVEEKTQPEESSVIAQESETEHVTTESATTESDVVEEATEEESKTEAAKTEAVTTETVETESAATEAVSEEETTEEDVAETTSSSEEKPAKYNYGNFDHTYTALDDTPLRSKADGKPKVLIFYNDGEGETNAQHTIQSISSSISDFGGVDIYAIECSGASQDKVSTFKTKYGCNQILFAYDEKSGVNIAKMSEYTERAGIGGGTEVSAPIICYIDANNKFQMLTEGESSAPDVLDNLEVYCYTFNITYELDGGTNDSGNPSTYTSKTETIELKNPTKENYKFEGWYTDAAFTQKVTEIAKGSTGDITLYAKWDVAKYNLKNPMQFYNPVADGMMDSKASNNKPKVLIFYFNENTKSQQTIESIRDNINAFSGADIYAIECSTASKESVSAFQKKYGCSEMKFAYNTTKDININYMSAYTEKIGIPEGSDVVLPVICYIDANNYYQLLTQKECSADFVLTMLEEYCDYSFKITYELDGGTNNSDNPSTYTSKTETIKLKDAVKEGCTFEGWYTDAAFTQKITEISQETVGDITLYAKWRVIQYDKENPEQKYTALDGTEIRSTANGKPKVLIFYVNDDIHNRCKNTIKSLRDHIKDFSGADIYAIECGKTDKDSISAFQNEYGCSDIRFAYDTAGTVNEAGMKAYELVATGANKQTYTYPYICYIDTNNKFQLMTEGESSAEDVLAKLKDYCGYVVPQNVYSITYELDGGTNNSNNPSYYSSGTTVTLQDPAREGYDFAGWYKDAEYSQKVTEIAKESTGDVTLYAKWKEGKYNRANLDQTYTALDGTPLSSKADGRPKVLVFYAYDDDKDTLKSISSSIGEFNGADIYAIECGKGKKDAVSKDKERYGCDQILFAYAEGSANMANMQAYMKEIGMSTAITYSVTPIICYIDSENKYQMLTSGNSSAQDVLANLQYYCGYVYQPGTYKITYRLDGGINDSGNPAVYTSETETIALKDAAKEGCTFDGWYKDAAYKEKVTEIPKGSTGDITLYAKWTVKKYDLANLDQTYTAIDGTKFSSTAAGKPKVLIFFNNTVKSQNTIKSISARINNFYGADLYAIECDKDTKDNVSKFQKQYGCDTISFAYDEGDTNHSYMSAYATAAGLAEGTTVTLPIICYIDADNKFQMMTQDESSADDVLNNLRDYCNFVIQDSVYKITYELDGGTNHKDNPSTYTSATETIVLKDASKKGYMFGGWYKDKALTKKVTAIAKGSKGDITLYAKWLVEKYNLANLNQTYTALDGTKLSSKASGKPKVLIFYIYNSKREGCKDTLTDISKNIGSFDGVDIYAIECNKGKKSDVSADQKSYGTAAIPFAYDEKGTVNKPSMKAYEKAATGKNRDTYTYPLICYIDANNRFQLMTMGPSSTDDMLANLRDYCGYSTQDGEAEIKITFISKSFTYNGQEQTPEVVVTTVSNRKSVTLREGTDYQLAYKNNKNAGTATVVVTGIGQYTGTVEENFVINPAPLVIRAVDMVLLTGDKVPSEYEYEVHGLIAPDVLIKEPVFACDAAGTAKEGVYAVELSGADAGSNYAITYEDGTLVVRNANSGPSYNEDERIDLSGASAAPIKDKVYDGYSYEPVIKLTMTAGGNSKRTLTEGADYVVEYTNNVNAGQGSAVITGVGLYKGTLTQRFEIKAKPIKKLKVIVGSMVVGDSDFDIPIEVYDGTRLIEDGEGYELSGPSNIAAKASQGVNITIKGIGNYTGETTAKIVVYDGDRSKIIKPEDVSLDKDRVAYTGKAVKDVTPQVAIGGTSLQAGKDYKVKYQNNKEAGTAYVIVTGKGAYKGTVVKEFTIYAEEGSLDIAEIKARTYNGKLQKPSIKVKSGNKTLKKNKDYVITYTNNLYSGTAMVKVTGIGSYKGSARKTFVIKEQKISKVSIKGTKNSGLTLTYAGRILKEGRDYTLTYDEVKNNKVTITAVDGSDFYGSATKSVKTE